MPVKRILYVLAFLLISIESFAQQDFYQNIRAIYPDQEFRLDPSKIFTISSADTLTFEDVLNASESKFTRLDKVQKLDRNHDVWAFILLKNGTDSPLEIVLEGGRNSIETYHIVTDSLITKKQTGYFISSSQRDIPRGYTTKIKVLFEPRQLIRFYVKYDSNDGLPIDIHFNGTTAEAWDSKQKELILFEGIFTGIILLILTLNGFIYGFTKEKVFFYFGAYAICNLVYFLHIHGFVELLIFPNSANAFSWLWLIPFLVAGFYFLFTREFLELDEEKPKLGQLTKYVGYGSIGLFFILSVYLFLADNIYLATSLLNYFLLFSVGLSFVLVYVAFNMRSIVSNYFAIGTTLLMVTVAIAVINQIFYLSNAVPVYVQLGIIIETIVFSIGMSHKLKKDYEDHLITQQSLILQLTKADKIQKGKTQELEEIVADRTQKVKEQNLQLEEARSTAEIATKAKSDFLSVMSHEIRTPLNAIISLSHIMELDNKDDEMNEYIDALKFSAESLHSLINDILDYNKIEAGKLRLENIEFSLIDLMKNVRDSFKYKANSKGVELQVEIGEHLPDKYKGDPTRLTQIFNNLISNGIKFTEQGHVKLKAELLGIKDNLATLKFEVKDTGIGIPKDRIDSIFEEFEQASASTTRNFGGTGLGLSITQKLLQMMSSDISIESEENTGSKFTFELTLEIDQEFDLVNLQLQDRTRDLNASKILVVDDNDMNRLVLKRLLAIWNAKFIEVSTGQDAIETVKSNAIDLVLMDLQMQPMDGFEATEKISTINAEIPVIAMSANQPGDFEEDYYKTGFSSFVHKPFDPEDLYIQIIKLLNTDEKKHC